MAIIDKGDAMRIARKLRAVIDKSGKAHDVALIYHEKKLIAFFGIRRGSKKGLGHGHVPSDLHLTFAETKKLSQCTLSYDQWLEKLRNNGILD